MGKRFELKIKLGNEAMSDAPAIAEALRKVADTLDSDYVGCDPIEPTEPSERGTIIQDHNGDMVGHWLVMD